MIFSTIDSITLGRLLVKLSQKKKKPKSRARIRYRLSTRFDLRNLNYATENEPDTGTEENSDFEEIAETFEETTEEEENISFVREDATPLSQFEETSVESFDVVEHTASQGLGRKVIDF